MIGVDEMRFGSAPPCLLVSESSLRWLQVNNQELLHNTNLSAKYPFGHICKTDKGNIGIFEKGEFRHNQCWLWLTALLQLQDAKASCIEMPGHPRSRSLKTKTKPKPPVSYAVINPRIAQGMGSLGKSDFPSQKERDQDCLCFYIQMYRHRVLFRNGVGCGGLGNK